MPEENEKKEDCCGSDENCGDAAKTDEQNHGAGSDNPTSETESAQSADACTNADASNDEAGDPAAHPAGCGSE